MTASLRIERLEPRDVPSVVGAELPGQFVVLVRPEVNAETIVAEVQGRGDTVTHVYSSSVNGFAYTGRGFLPDSRVLSLQRDQEVSLGGVGSAAGRPSSPPPPPAAAQVVPDGVKRIGGAAIGGSGANYQNVNVAVIDSGIDGSHPDLNVVGGRNFTSTKPQNWQDENGHGTHVAGTVAAEDNGIGVVGVAPGASLWAVRVLNRQGFGSVSGIVAGIDWVTATRTDADPANDIAVANMSLGIYGNNAALETAVRRSVEKGVVYTVAAMNESVDASLYSPARYDVVLTVSAMADSDGLAGGLGVSTWAGADDTLATFSNHGSIIDIAAPGVDILSTLPGGRYGEYSGTSMAAPHVAGAAVRHIVATGMKPTTAAGVAGLRDALVAFARPMSEWGPNAVASDPDAFHEGVLRITA
jgi:subtilisin family serine protease